MLGKEANGLWMHRSFKCINTTFTAIIVVSIIITTSTAMRFSMPISIIIATAPTPTTLTMNNPCLITANTSAFLLTVTAISARVAKTDHTVHPFQVSTVRTHTDTIGQHDEIRDGDRAPTTLHWSTSGCICICHVRVRMCVSMCRRGYVYMCRREYVCTHDCLYIVLLRASVSVFPRVRSQSSQTPASIRGGINTPQHSACIHTCLTNEHLYYSWTMNACISTKKALRTCYS